MKRKNISPMLWTAIGFLAGFALCLAIAIIQCKCAIVVDWNTVIACIAALAAVCGVIESAYTYKDSTERAKKIETLREFSAIREKYPNMSPKSSAPASEEERIAYLKAMERFCTGINLGLYDIEVVKKTSGAMLRHQYQSYLKDIIDEKRAKVKEADPKDIYCQYEKVINELEKEDQPVCRITKNNLK